MAPSCGEGELPEALLFGVTTPLPFHQPVFTNTVMVPLPLPVLLVRAKPTMYDGSVATLPTPAVLDMVIGSPMWTSPITLVGTRPWSAIG